MSNRKQTGRPLTLAILFVACLCGSNAWAVPTNPDPAQFNDDVGAISTGHGDGAFVFEVADTLSPDTTFGFYFIGSAGTRITLFDGADVGPPQPKVAVDFLTGEVFDINTLALKSTFTASLDPIGFWFEIVNEPVVFSDPALNPGGADWFGLFTSRIDPAGGLAVSVENPVTNEVLSINTLFFVPEPHPLLLMLLAAPMLVWRAIKRGQRGESAPGMARV